MRDEPVYRGILAIDIERFSRAEWTHPVRKRLRGRLHRPKRHWRWPMAAGRAGGLHRAPATPAGYRPDQGRGHKQPARSRHGADAATDGRARWRAAPRPLWAYRRQLQPGGGDRFRELGDRTG